MNKIVQLGKIVALSGLVMQISIETSSHRQHTDPSISNFNDRGEKVQDTEMENHSTQKKETYNKRAGTVDHGKKYECLLCAYYALTLSCYDSNIIDFSMTTNNADYEDFDDVELTVEYADKTSHTFLIQLKHSDSDKRGLTAKMLAGQSKDFGLLKYVKSFRKLQNQKNITCILSSNRKTQIQNNSEFSMDFGKITSKQCQSSNSKCLLLDTSETKNSCFYFKLEQTQGCTDDTSEFFRCFYLFTNQNNHLKIRSQIDQMLVELLGCRIEEFINFMQQWWEGNFVLAKHDVIVKLAELALTPFIQEIPKKFDESFLNKSKPLKNAIEKFEMTLVKNGLKDSTIGQIWAGTAVEECKISRASLKYGLSKVGRIQLSSLEYSKVLWFLNKVPLIVKWEEKEDKRIRGAIRLLEKEPNKMRIIILTNITKEEFPGWQILQNLYDLRNEKTCYTEIIENFKISLQGRPSISLKQLIDSNTEVAKAIETHQLFLMLEEDLYVGKSSQKLPEAYISRNISTLFLDTEKILDYYKSVKNILLIINYNNQLGDAINLRNTETKDLEEFLLDLQSGISSERKLVILAKDNKCTTFNFKEICDKCKTNYIYLLKIIDYNCSTLVLAKGDTSFFQKMRHETIKIKENQLYSVFNNPLNIVTGQPGSGKSTLLTYLRQQCASDCWCVLVKLIEYSSFLNKHPSTNEILNEFLKSEGPFFENIKTKLQQNGKLYLLLDGLDEISSYTVETVLNFIGEIYSAGVKVWITSRENLKEIIIQRLNIFAIELEDVTEEEQRRYIRKRLCNKYVEEEIERIVSAMFQSISISNNIKNILGVPLQLYIITEIFLNDKEAYEKLKSEDIFVLSKMYRLFFQGREKHQESKAEIKNKEAFNDYFDYKLKLYEMPALRTCLARYVFNKLKLESCREFSECDEFLRKLKMKGDKLGIIDQVVEENHTLEAIFCHQSFAEYFACVWLKNNVDKLRLLKTNICEAKYENLRLMFDIMLAEDNPLHLATLYKNPEQVKKYIEDFNKKDKGGRSALQLICSYGAKYSYNYRNSKRDTTTYINIFEILSICDHFEHDLLFDWSCLDYALNCECLYPFEKYCKRLEDVVKRFDKTKLATFCAYSGYSNILKALIERDRNLLNLKGDDNDGDSLLIIAARGSLNFDEINLKQMNIETIKMLIKCGCDVNYFNSWGESALHIAVEGKGVDKNLIEVLLDNKANANRLSSRGRTPLLLACGNPDNSILESLIRYGVDVNYTTRSRITPLYIACEKGIYRNVITLLKSGADIKAATYLDRTLLYVASMSSNNVDVVNILLQNKLDINAADWFDYTPLCVACSRGTHDIVKILVENGANIHPVTHEKNTLLHFASRNSEKSVQQIIRFLIDQGIKIEDLNDKGFTALQEACSFCNYNAIEKLIENGANVNVTTKSKQVLLHLLANSCVIESDVKGIIELLTEKGVDINAEDEKGYTALHQSAFMARYSLCKALIEHGSNVNALTKSNENSLHVLVKNKMGFYGLEKKIIKLLTTSGMDVNQVNEDGDTVVQIAVRKRKYVNFIKTLLENGYDINVKTSQNETLLHLALKNVKPDIATIQLLIDKCEELVNEVDKSEVSPLLLAYQSGDRLAIYLLLEKDILLDHNTRNFLMRDFPNLLMSGYVELLRILFGNVPNLEELNTDDKEFPPNFPLHLAKRNGCLQVDLLLEIGGYIEEYKIHDKCYHRDENLASYIIRKFSLSFNSNSEYLSSTSNGGDNERRKIKNFCEIS